MRGRSSADREDIAGLVANVTDLAQTGMGPAGNGMKLGLQRVTCPALSVILIYDE